MIKTVLFFNFSKDNKANWKIEEIFKIKKI